MADPNLSRAAERLHLTQSGLSKRLQAIERELGCDLFERRGPKGLRVLPQALELGQVAGRMLSAWETAVKRVQREASEPPHFVLVGPPLFLREVVLPWWTLNSQKYPEIRLEVQVASLQGVSLDTVATDADAGILEHKEELGDFVCKPLFVEEWGVVRNPSVQKTELKDYLWGTYSPSVNLVDTWLVQRQKMPPPVYRFYWEDMTAIAVWVASTPGAASVLPHHAIRWLEKKKRVVFEPLGVDATKKLYLAFKRNNPHKKLIHEFLQLQNVDITEHELR